MLKDYILELVDGAVQDAVRENKLGNMSADDEYILSPETPKNEEFGDFAVNVSSLARLARLAPAVIAQNVAEYIKCSDMEINTVAGFINFKLGKSFLETIVADILNEKADFGNPRRHTAAL